MGTKRTPLFDWNLDQLYFGLEWEPQLTLLDYGAKPVKIDRVYIPEGHCRVRQTRTKVVLEASVKDLCAPWFEAGVGTDPAVGNLEVRTSPFRFTDYPAICRQMTQRLAHQIQRWAPLVGPIAVFLPGSKAKSRRVSKHLNVSPLAEWTTNKFMLNYRCRFIQYERHCQRLINPFCGPYWLQPYRGHLKVPYNWRPTPDNILDLLRRRSTRQAWKRASHEPQVLMYTYTGEHVAIVRNLY